jgi:hypothetical protein
VHTDRTGPDPFKLRSGCICQMAVFQDACVILHLTLIMTTDTISFQISFKGTLYELKDRDSQSTVQELKQHLQDLTGVPVERQKLMFKGLMKNEQTLSEAKVSQGSKIMLIGSKDEDIKQVQEIDKRVERMKTTPIRKAKVYKSGTSKEDIRYNFHKISVIEEFPEPEKARKLLERLKIDRGVSHCFCSYTPRSS